MAVPARYNNAGRLEKVDEGSPPEGRDRKWLILSGASNPPKDVILSKRRPRNRPEEKNGQFLHGITLDIHNM